MPHQVGDTDVWVYSEAEDKRERRCVNHRICACDHTRCRDGFLDDEVSEPRPGRPDRTVVQRCPHCYDAALMTAEQQGGNKGKGSRW